MRGVALLKDILEGRMGPKEKKQTVKRRCRTTDEIMGIHYISELERNGTVLKIWKAWCIEPKEDEEECGC